MEPAPFELLLQPCDLLARSQLFDPTFYLERNPDIAAARVDAAEHYLGLDGAKVAALASASMATGICARTRT